MRVITLKSITFHRVADRVMIYLQAHELFTENTSWKYVFHRNGHIFNTFCFFLLSKMCRPGKYPILQSPVLTTFGFVPHRPTSTSKPINPAVLSPAAGSSQQGSFNSLLDMGNSAQKGSLSSGSSIPCAEITS